MIVTVYSVFKLAIHMYCSYIHMEPTHTYAYIRTMRIPILLAAIYS